MVTKEVMNIYFGGSCEIKTEGFMNVRIKKKRFIPYSQGYLRKFANEVKPAGLRIALEVIFPFKFFGKEILIQERVL